MAENSSVNGQQSRTGQTVAGDAAGEQQTDSRQHVAGVSVAETTNVAQQAVAETTHNVMAWINEVANVDAETGDASLRLIDVPASRDLLGYNISM